MKKGYFSIVVTIFLLSVGLLHLPSISINSLEGLFSLLWFALGGTVVLSNFIHINKTEKEERRSFARIKKRYF